MAKVYAGDPVACPAEQRIVHDLVYMGRTRIEGRKQRSLEYRCGACGEFIRKDALQSATQGSLEVEVTANA